MPPPPRYQPAEGTNACATCPKPREHKAPQGRGMQRSAHCPRTQPRGSSARIGYTPPRPSQGMLAKRERPVWIALSLGFWWHVFKTHPKFLTIGCNSLFVRGDLYLVTLGAKTAAQLNSVNIDGQIRRILVHRDRQVTGNRYALTFE